MRSVIRFLRYWNRPLAESGWRATFWGRVVLLAILDAYGGVWAVIGDALFIALFVTYTVDSARGYRARGNRHEIYDRNDIWGD